VWGLLLPTNSLVLLFFSVHLVACPLRLLPPLLQISNQIASPSDGHIVHLPANDNQHKMSDVTEAQPAPSADEAKSVTSPFGGLSTTGASVVEQASTSATEVASSVAGSAAASASGVKDSVFSMFGGGAKKEKKADEEDEEAKNEPSGSSKAKKDEEEVSASGATCDDRAQ